MRSAAATGRRLRELFDSGDLDIPLPGSGDTPLRHRALTELGRIERVGVARLAEAHCDAVAILREAGHQPRGGAIYGVWASATADGAPHLSGDVVNGAKPFCSGLGIVDRALMVVTTRGGHQQLLDIDARPGETVAIDTSGWHTNALSDTRTGQITYTDHDIDPDARIGTTDWYLERPGFWHGACGPAACWAGATLGIIDAATAMVREDPHQLAHVGAMHATQWSLTALFDQAGLQIDEHPSEVNAAELRARSLRHSTERLCADVLDRFERAFGPRPFVSDPDLADRFADAHIYLRQHHGERELAAIVAVARGAEG